MENRAIKFRAWDKPENKMTYEVQNQYDWNILSGECFGELLRDNDYIIMQFTGLKDKNGKDIYEGDIIDLHRFTQIFGEDLGVSEGKLELVCEVKIGTCGIEFHHKKDFIYFLNYCINNDEGEQIEVIGNIHQNSSHGK